MGGGLTRHARGPRGRRGGGSDALEELTVLAPWVLLPAAPDRPDGVPGIDGIPTLRELAELEEQSEWSVELRGHNQEANRRARARIAESDRLARQAGDLARMGVDFLFDKTRRLLAIGDNVGERRRDSSFYDLLASEARLCS